MGYVHSKNRPPRADRKESLASLPFCCKRKIFEEFISRLFHGDPRGREGTSSVNFVERGPGPPACRAYRASFLPLDWSAPSNWRSRKEKRKKSIRREDQWEREKGRKRETDEEGGSEWREESNVCCRHANSCWTATWKGLVGSSDLTARNLVSDTINIGPGELSQSRGSLRSERESGWSKVFVVWFFLPVNHAVSEPLFY